MIRLTLLVLLSTFFYNVYSQHKGDVFVDKQGVMRWGDTKEEVYGFGVNYTVPFAHAYRSGKKLNVNLEQEIEYDIYHFSRLGFDAFRVHVWDTEISDSIGNLKENDHLKLFDFMLYKMKQRGMKLFLTPIAFWGNGWPEPDEKTSGFSSKYGKDACLTNPDAIKAQENYLYQFMNHVNPYTKLAYKNDPDIIGFEVSNEPHHHGTKEEVKKYINRMVASIRKSGCKKPVLYNISHSIHLADAYFESDINGGTFQWYPTGLGARHELRGNFLPNVERYAIPFANHPGFKKMAKVAYEFDAADIGRSYIYPAMARGFREAGIQWATHFSYDPTFLAFANTEYNTHYMNLVYAPQKALSLKICSEVFHKIPRYKSYGAYPANTVFDQFKISYENDLAEYNAPDKFFYTNNTTSDPVHIQSLKEIAGYGSSNVVQYNGTGAYFLDKIEDGIWRLEVLPDAIWIDNLFGRNSLKKTVAIINWRNSPMAIRLPDLGSTFIIKPIKSSLKEQTSNNYEFSATPGVYLLKRKGIDKEIDPNLKFKNITLQEFTAPSSTLEKDMVLHEPVTQHSSGKPFTIKATIVTKEIPDQVKLHVWAGPGSKILEMKSSGGYHYSAEIPGTGLKEGFITYFIEVVQKGKSKTFPCGTEGSPNDWDFYNTHGYKVALVKEQAPLYLFNAFEDADEVSREWRRGADLLPGEGPKDAIMVTSVDNLKSIDPENKNGKPIHDFSLRYNFSKKVAGRQSELTTFNKIIIRGKSYNKSFPIQIALIDKEANTYGALINLEENKVEYVIHMETLKQVEMVTLPRPYPGFLPYYFKSNSTKPFNPQNIETIQISIGPGIVDVDTSYRYGIESIRLEK